MATEETVQLNELHAPQQASIDAFDSILGSLKEELVKLRRDHDSKRNALTSCYMTNVSHRTRARVLPCCERPIR